MIISGKNLKRILNKGINSVSKKLIAKSIGNYLLKNKNRIIEIKIIQPEYQLQQISSDGSTIRKAITNETYTIILKPKKEVING